MRPDLRRLTPLTPATRLALALALALPWTAEAGLYCCEDASGKRVCADTLPKACVGRGYSVRESGKSLRTVAPPPTAEELAQRAADAERRKAEEAAAKEQALKDQALLATYSNPADIDAAQKRAEADVDTTIKHAQNKIAQAEKRRAKLNADAEFYKHKALPPEIQSGLRDVDFEVKAQQDLIAAKEKDKTAIRAKYDGDRTRYNALRSGAVAMPKVPPEPAGKER